MILRQWCHHGECIHSFYYLLFIPPFLNLFIIQIFLHENDVDERASVPLRSQVQGDYVSSFKSGGGKTIFSPLFLAKKIRKS
jgi:hypothetical protein